jgi:glycosyltransferase involved in cell wall biosynthesis
VDDVDRRAAQPAPVLDPGRFHLIAVGRLNPQKGHLDLLRAMNQLVHQRQQHHLHLHLLGQGPLEAELRQFVDRQQLRDHVTFAGYVSNPLPYVKGCQLFCLPSLYEGLPLALLEAMACAVPVLAADCPSGPREVLADGRFGRLVPAADPQALTDAIADTVDDPDAGQQLVRAARQRVVECYSTTAVIGQLEQLLLDVGSA